MSTPIHTSHITITREKGPTRKALIKGFSEPVFYGVHGGIKDFYKIEPEKEYAATLDHIIGAVGGWMMGTLATVLAGKGIQTSQDLYRSEISGDIEDVNGVLKITRINVHYFLKVPDGKKEDAREALKIYLSKCPAAQSVIGCIDIKDGLTFVEN